MDDPAIHRLHGSPNRRAYLLETLDELDRDLRAKGSGLVHRRGPWLETVLDTADEAGVDRVMVSRDVSGFAQTRNRRLIEVSPVPVVERDDDIDIPEDEIDGEGAREYVLAARLRDIDIVVACNAVRGQR